MLGFAESRPVKELTDGTGLFFIIGPPRSGSTLVFQVLTSVFDVGYTSNAHANYFGGISFYERWNRKWVDRSEVAFESKFGATAGRSSPNECGSYWYQFFRRSPQYVPNGEADVEKMKKLGNSLTRIQDAFKKPFVFKNMNCALRLGPLTALLPRASFIVINRDLVQNSHSLLEARLRLRDSFDVWWSMEPPAIEEIKTLDPPAQVVEQVKQIHAEIDRYRGNSNNFFDLNYEEFCNAPANMVSKLERFILENSGDRLKVPLRTGVESPATFTVRQDVRIPEELFRKIVSYAEPN